MTIPKYFKFIGDYSKLNKTIISSILILVIIPMVVLPAFAQMQFSIPEEVDSKTGEGQAGETFYFRCNVDNVDLEKFRKNLPRINWFIKNVETGEMVEKTLPVAYFLAIRQDLNEGTYEISCPIIDLTKSIETRVLTLKVTANELVGPTPPKPICDMSDPTSYSSNSSDKCKGDCTDPTFYDSQHREIVKDAFTYNGFSTDVIKRHIETPEIIVNTNQTNFITLKVYDNGGVNNIKWVDVGFGMPGINYHISHAEASIEVLLDDAEIKELRITDKHNLIDFGNVTSQVVDCGYLERECIEVTIPHVFRDTFENNIILIGATDYRHNEVSNYLNDGITIDGDSINEAPTDKIWRQKYLGNSDWEWIDIVRTDRINDIWTSEEGIEFKGTHGGGFQRVNPITFQ